MKTEEQLHRVLLRQLRRVGVRDPRSPPPRQAWEKLLQRISRTYAGNEEDRYLLERSLEISSEEMQALYEQLRKASESRIAAERDRLESVLNAIGDGLCVLDREGRIVSMNPAAIVLLGRPEEELVDTPALSYFALTPTAAVVDGDAERSGALSVDTLLAPLYVDGDEDELADTHDDVPRIEDGDPLALVLAGNSLRYERGLLVRSPTAIIPVACKLDPLVQHGDITGVVFLFRDMSAERLFETRLHNLTLRLRAARDAAIDASRTKSAFLAKMSHELRTPLNAIIGYSDLISEEADEYDLDMLGEDITRIQDAGEHLLHLINDILDISKIEAGKMEVFIERFAVLDIVRSVTNTIGPLMSRSGNRFVLDCPDDLGEINTDRTKLRQALLNLLSNASKFTLGGACTLRVRPFTRDGSSWMRFEVSDTGIGIPHDKLEGLFEAFTQAEESTTRNFGGTGLGLAITRHFCNMLGGDISVSSVYGEGSTFTIELPTGQHASEARAHARASSTRGATDVLLVIDDDAQVFDMVRRAMEKQGFTVVYAHSGDDGLRIARELKPAVITLDVQFPGIDGWGILSELKSDPALAEIPVVMLSIVSEQQRAFRLGAAEYLVKPVEPRRLSAVLRRYRGAGKGVVLIAEDDPETRAVLRRALERDGWSTSVAENGRVALEQLERITPDVVLLDLMMPITDGFEVIASMRASVSLRAIPIVVLTAMELSQQERELLRLGASRVLTKGSLPLDQIAREIGSMIERTGVELTAREPDHVRDAGGDASARP